MKKLISVLLAMLMLVLTFSPVFAAEGEGAGDAEPAVTHTVYFQAPQKLETDAFIYVVSVNGEVQYVEDENGEYVFFDNRYMLPSNVLPSYQDKIPPERYSPVEYKGSVEVAHGDTISFKILTSEKYNVYTASVFVKTADGPEVAAKLNAQYDYTMYVDKDLYVRVAEVDSKTGEPVLLRNHYNVKLTSGDGYKVKTLKNENYHVTYYGDSFEFRVQVDKGYSAAGIKVSVQRGAAVLGGFLDEEDTDMLVGILGGTEPLTSYGVDEDGCRLYRVENVTTDCRIIVSGLQEESSAGIMAFFKRILRLIVNLFGLKLDILDSLTAYYNVAIDASEADGVTYQVIRSTEDEITPSEFTVTSGDGVTLIVTKKDPDQVVNVKWTPGNELGTYETNWILDYNHLTGEASYVAVYNIDNITADTRIIIS